MTSQEDFEKLLAADPKDDHSRLVFADWLDEHDQPVAAARIRWAVKARRRTGEEGRPRDPERSYTVEQRHLPEWVARWNQVNGVRQAFEGTEAGRHPAVRAALHAAEMHAYGLLDEPTLRHYRTSLPKHTLPGIIHAPRDVRWALRGLFNTPANGPGSENILEHAAIHRVSSLDQPQYMDHNVLAAHDHATQKLRDFHRTDPAPTEGTPTRLARPLGWLADKVRGLLGKKTAPTTAPGPLLPHAQVAVHAGLRHLSSAHNHLGGKYADVIAQLVHDHPEAAPVKEFQSAVAASDDPTTLTTAVKPLLWAANIRRVQAGLDQPFKGPNAKPAAPATALPEHAPGEAYGSTFVSPLAVPEEAPSFTHEDLEGKLKEHGGRMQGAMNWLHAHHGMSPIEARRVVQNFVALHLGRERLRKFQRAVKKNPDAKLAAYTGGPINSRHLAGEAYRTDLKPRGQQPKVDYHLADTGLAYHLRAIAREHPDLSALAERALANPFTLPAGHGATTGVNHFAKLGAALAKRNDPAAKLYDWANLAEQIKRDKRVEELTKQHVEHQAGRGRYANDAERNLGFWDGVTRRMLGNTAFLDRISANSGLTHEQIADSVRRVRDRALDKAYVHNSARLTDEERANLAVAPTEVHRRLDRKSDWISKKIAIILRDGIRGKKVSQKQAAAVAYSMWRDKHGDE